MTTLHTHIYIYIYIYFFFYTFIYYILVLYIHVYYFSSTKQKGGGEKHLFRQMYHKQNIFIFKVYTAHKELYSLDI